MGIIYYAASDKAQIYYELGKIYSFVTLKPRDNSQYNCTYDIVAMPREVEESSFGLKVRSLYRLFPDLKIVTDNHDLLDHPEYRHIGSVFE